MNGIPVVRTVESNTPVTVSVRSPLVHLCPYVDETDHGEIVVSWRVEERTLELHSLRAYFGAFSGIPVSHEALTNLIWTELGSLSGLHVIGVETVWTTAGMEVVCGTSETLHPFLSDEL